MRAANRACIRLGMISSVFYIVILRIAGRAHREITHRCFGPVIRNILNNRKPWPAVGAVYKRISISPVSRGKHFPQAVIADTDIGRNQRVAKCLPLTGPDFKILKPTAFKAVFRFYILNNGQPRRSGRNFRDKTFQNFPLSIQLKFHAGGRIFNKPLQVMFPHKPVDKRTEPDALHNTMYFNKGSFHFPPRFPNGKLSSAQATACERH